MQVEITARLIKKGDDSPLTGDNYTVRLYDRDFFEDEFLGECLPNEEGRVKFFIASGTFKHNAFDDKNADFFFVVFLHSKPVYISKVMEHVYTEGLEKYIKGEGLVVDLGTFLVDTNSSA